MPNGKICYLEIPATDVERSAAFYSDAFGWSIRTRGDGARAFDDTTGGVSGTWVLGRAPTEAPGILTYIMVDNVAGAIRKVEAGGGRVVTPQTPLGPGGEAYATFRDPAGNLFGLYQEAAR